MKIALLIAFFLTNTAMASTTAVAEVAETTTPEQAIEAVIPQSEKTPEVVNAKDAAAIADKAESEIPLNLEAKKSSQTEGSPIFRILFSLSILGVVGTGAFIFIKRYSVPKGMKHQTQIKVLQQHYLGPKKSLAIVRVAGESILIGVTDHNISMIKSLALLDEEIPENMPTDFESVIHDFDRDETAATPKKQVARKATSATAKANELDVDEEFAISGIKDIVSKRLKGMRSFQ